MGGKSPNRHPRRKLPTTRARYRSDRVTVASICFYVKKRDFPVRLLFTRVSTESQISQDGNIFRTTRVASAREHDFKARARMRRASERHENRRTMTRVTQDLKKPEDALDANQTRDRITDTACEGRSECWTAGESGAIRSGDIVSANDA